MLVEKRYYHTVNGTLVYTGKKCLDAMFGTIMDGPLKDKSISWHVETGAVLRRYKFGEGMDIDATIEPVR